MNITAEYERYLPFLELIAADGGEAFLPPLEALLEETGGAEEILVLQHLGLGAFFFAVEDDLWELVQQLKKVAAHWSASVLSAAEDWEEESALYDYEPSLLLQLVARELHDYDLSLWQIAHSDLCCGFMARRDDEDLILKNAAILRLRCERVSPLSF